ncbi:MAG: DUF6614 family protein [Planctomycetota bacterium]
MDHYEIWCNLADSHKDLEFAQAVADYLGFLKDRGRIAGYRMTRRKFGFGPPELGEFHITIDAENLTQLDQAFDAAARRTGEVEKLHARVYSLAKDFRSGLFRDFPDPQRGKPLT